MDGVGEGGLDHPLDHEPLRVDVGEDEVAVAPVALPFGEENAVLRDHEVAPEDDVGGRLVDPGVGVHVGGESAARLLADELAPIVRLGHEIVGGGEVQDHGGAGDRVMARRGDGRPEVLAHLGGEHDFGGVLEREQEVGAEGHALPRDRGLVGDRVPGRGEPTLLVVLLVVGNEGLGDEPQETALLAKGRDVEEAAVQGHGQSDRDHRRQAGRSREAGAEGPSPRPGSGCSG